jgi:hypothetical protein
MKYIKTSKVAAQDVASIPAADPLSKQKADAAPSDTSASSVTRALLSVAAIIASTTSSLPLGSAPQLPTEKGAAPEGRCFLFCFPEFDFGFDCPKLRCR